MREKSTWMSRAIRAAAGIAGGILAVAVLAPLPASAVAPPAPSGSAWNPSVSRISGADRYSTAIAIAQAAFPGTAPIVFVATGTNYPDALATGPVAAKLGGPLLLTDPMSLPAPVAAEIGTLHPQTVVIVGGLGAVSASVESALRTAAPGATVTRVAGSDRFDTGRKVVQYGFPSANHLYISTGDNYPDALSAAAAAGARGEPIVLLNGNASALDRPSSDFLHTLSVSAATIVGGTGAVSQGLQTSLNSLLGSGNVSRLSGTDRFDSSRLIAADAFTTASTAYLATGLNYPDALAGSALAGHAGAPLFSSLPTCMPLATRSELESLGVQHIVMIGGPGALDSDVQNLTPCNVDVHASTAPTLPGATGDSTLSDMSCVAQDDCIAVGSVGTDSLIEKFDGTAWSAVPVPALPYPFSENGTGLNAVTCTDPDFCVAVGTSIDSLGLSWPIVDTFDGTTWTAQRVTLPPDVPTYPTYSNGAYVGFAELDGVACSTAGACVAIGSSIASSGITMGLVATLSEGVWTAVDAPMPPGSLSGYSSQTASTTAVACRPGGACYVAGFVDGPADSNGYLFGSTFMDTFSSGTWTTQAMPVPKDAALYPSSRIYSIDCPDAQTCIGVGRYLQSGSPAEHGLAVTVTGATWKAVEVAHPADGQSYSGTVLASIACQTATSCEAVGWADQPSGAGPALFAQLQGTTWTATRSQLPADAKAGRTGIATLWSVGCGVANVCIGTGDYNESSQGIGPGFLGLALGAVRQGNAITVPASGATLHDGLLSSLSCSAARCIAVGDALDSSGTEHAIIQTITW